MTDYLTKFDGQAITIEDFLQCMEKASGCDLTQFRRWYTQAGTPTVKASWTYNEENNQLILKLSQHTEKTRGQKEKLPFYMPIRISFLNAQGQSVHPAELEQNGIIILSEESQEYAFTLDKNTIPVLLRDFSAPVRLEAPYTEDDYAHMLKNCDDAFIKVDSAVSLQNKYIHENIDKVAHEILPEDPKDLIEVTKYLLENRNEDTDLHLLNEAIKIQPLINMMETFDSIDIDALNETRKVLKFSCCS